MYSWVCRQQPISQELLLLYTVYTLLLASQVSQVTWPYLTLHSVPSSSLQVKWLDHTWLCSLHSSSCQVRSSDLTVFGFTQCALFFLSSQVTWLYLTLHSVHSSSCQVNLSGLTTLDPSQCSLFFLSSQVTWLYLTLHSVHSSSLMQVTWLDYAQLYTVHSSSCPVKSSDLTMLDFTQCELFFLSSDLTILDFTQCEIFFLSNQVTWLYLTLHSVHCSSSMQVKTSQVTLLYLTLHSVNSSSCQIKWFDCAGLCTVCILLP